VTPLRSGNHVRLLGHRDDVMAIMDAVDVLIHPSRQEAFPTTLLEAMAAGTPIVATCTGGIPEIVENDVSAILIPSPPRPGPLADAIAKLLGTPGLRAELAVHGRARFAHQFAAGPWARRLREAYVAAIGQRAS